MNKNTKLLITVILAILVVGVIGWFVYGNYSEQPELNDNSQPNNDVVQNSDNEDDDRMPKPSEFPLSLPDGFEIEVLTDEVPNAGVIRRGPTGDLLVSRPDQGAISIVDLNNQGEVVSVYELVSGLDSPHGLAFDPNDQFKLYIAQEDEISTLQVYSESTLETVVEFPKDDNLKKRSLAFGPDSNLFVASCAGCDNSEYRYNEINIVDLQTGELSSYQSDLNNSVFFAWHEIDATMWPHENAPGELNESAVPLGIDFVPEEGWPEKYWYDALVAYHGEGENSEGYKIGRIGLSDLLEAGEKEDFISGWMSDSQILGQPVDIMIEPGGIMFISDSKAGAIYKLVYMGGNEKLITETDDIRLEKLAPNDSVKKNFQIIGEGKSEWFFEANVAIEAYSPNGNKIDTFTGTEAPDRQSSKGYIPFTAMIDLSDYSGDQVVLKFVKTDYADVPEPDEIITLPLQLEDSSNG